jgi:hypothetical protein
MPCTRISADEEQEIKVHLVGYQETPLTINTSASADFTAKIRSDGTAIDYELTYRDLSSPITQSHIHFGRPAITGMIVLFLCTNLTPPAGVPTPQACPQTNPAMITGTLTKDNVIPRPAQGIDPGASGFAEMLQAIRAGAAYVNVHSTTYPSGEIRRQGCHRRISEDPRSQRDRLELLDGSLSAFGSSSCQRLAV